MEVKQITISSISKMNFKTENAILLIKSAKYSRNPIFCIRFCKCSRGNSKFWKYQQNFLQNDEVRTNVINYKIRKHNKFEDIHILALQSMHHALCTHASRMRMRMLFFTLICYRILYQSFFALSSGVRSFIFQLLALF